MNINVTEDVKNETAHAKPAPFAVERLGARLGAEIHGLDLKKGLDPETFKALEAALIEHKIIVLRDQHLTTEQHVAISRPFGDLEVHPMRPQCESASNFDPRLDGRRPLNGNSFLGNWRGPDRRRSGPRLYGPFSLESTR